MSSHFNLRLGSVRESLPVRLDQDAIRRAVRDHESEARGVLLARLNRELAELLRNEGHIRKRGMNSHRLRRAKIAGVTQDRSPGHAAVNLSSHETPFSPRIIGLDAIRHAVGCEKMRGIPRA